MITLDLQGLIPHSFVALLNEDFITAVLDDVAAAARARWIKLARQQLNSSKRDYIDGIQEVDGSGNERFIMLVGRLPNMIEQGWAPHDLRETLLGEGKGKVSKSGHRYRAIPFRHGTPTSKGQAGTPMGARYGPQGPQSRAWAAEGVMDAGAAAELGNAVKRLRTKRLTTHAPGTPKGKAMVQVPKLAPWHKTDIYAGMRRVQKQYRTAKQAQYQTFRTISEANPIGWIHPGITERSIHTQVERDIEGMLGKIVRAAVRRSVGATT